MTQLVRNTKQFYLSHSISCYLKNLNTFWQSVIKQSSLQDSFSGLSFHSSWSPTQGTPTALKSLFFLLMYSTGYQHEKRLHFFTLRVWLNYHILFVWLKKKKKCLKRVCFIAPFFSFCSHYGKSTCVKKLLLHIPN